MLERFPEQQKLGKSIVVITRAGKQMFHWPLLRALGLPVCHHAWVGQKGIANKMGSPEAQINIFFLNQLSSAVFRDICKRNSKVPETTWDLCPLIKDEERTHFCYSINFRGRNWKPEKGEPATRLNPLPEPSFIHSAHLLNGRREHDLGWNCLWKENWEDQTSYPTLTLIFVKALCYS